MASRTAELRLRVRYGYEDRDASPSEEECKDLLNALVKLAVNRGLLTNESDLVVENYSHEVLIIGAD